MEGKKHQSEDIQEGDERGGKVYYSIHANLCVLEKGTQKNRAKGVRDQRDDREGGRRRRRKG